MRIRHSRRGACTWAPDRQRDEVLDPSGVSSSTYDSCPTHSGCHFQSCHASSDFRLRLGAARSSAFSSLFGIAGQYLYRISALTLREPFGISIKFLTFTSKFSSGFYFVILNYHIKLIKIF